MFNILHMTYTVHDLDKQIIIRTRIKADKYTNDEPDMGRFTNYVKGRQRCGGKIVIRKQNIFFI